MVCATCGTLNTAEAERCTQCGRPMAATVAESCDAHPERRAVSQCSRCGRSLCEACEVQVQGSPYCANDADALLSASPEGFLNATPVLDVREKPAATFGQRCQAGAIDVLLTGVYVMVIYLVLWAMLGVPPSHSDAEGWRVVYWLLVVLGPLGYLIYSGATGGQTAGKAVTDIIVLREDGTIIDFSTAVFRSVLSVIGFLLGGIGFWFILWDPARRALHDRLTHTLVAHE